MKNKKLIPVLSIITILFACEALVGSFTASINNVSWQAGFSGAVKNGNQYIITATKDNSSLVITIPGITTGNYTINPFDTTLEALLYTPDVNMSANNYVSTQGTVELTTISQGRLTGTFSVWAKNSQTSTDSIPITGQFNNILSN